MLQQDTLLGQMTPALASRCFHWGSGIKADGRHKLAVVVPSVVQGRLEASMPWSGGRFSYGDDELRVVEAAGCWDGDKVICTWR